MPMTLSGTTGIVLPTAAAPAFSAYQSTQQTLSANTMTKINFQTEEFDTNNNFDTTNMRFLPTVAGYYQVSGALESGSTSTQMVLSFYKNGSAFKEVFRTVSNMYASSGSVLIYMNGSTDYVELWGLFSNTQVVANTSLNTFFQAVMVRSA
jgi:hypothetical protein